MKSTAGSTVAKKACVVEDALAATRGVWEANPGMLGEDKQPQPVIGFEIPSGYEEYSSEEE